MREVHDENTVGIGDADQHQHTHQRHHVQGGVGQRQNDQHADETHGNRQHNQKGVDERTELSDQNQNQQDERYAEAVGKTGERLIHAIHHAAEVHADIGGELRLHDGLLDLARQLAQILTLGSDIDVDDALDLIVIDLRRGLEVFQIYYTIEGGGLLQIRRPQRDRLQID